MTNSLSRRHLAMIAIFTFLFSVFFLRSIEPVYADELLPSCAAYNKALSDYNSANYTPDEEATVSGKNLQKQLNAKNTICQNDQKKAASASAAAIVNSGDYGLQKPLGNADVAGVIARLIKFLLVTSGSVALIMVVWGGLQYLLAAGEEGKVKKGKETLTNALLGLVIIFSAYMLVNTVIKALSGL